VAAEQAVEVRTDLVALALLQVVALLAAGLEEVGTLLRVAWNVSQSKYCMAQEL
jgi:hypothetical protein